MARLVASGVPWGAVMDLTVPEAEVLAHEIARARAEREAQDG